MAVEFMLQYKLCSALRPKCKQAAHSAQFSHPAGCSADIRHVIDITPCDTQTTATLDTDEAAITFVNNLMITCVI